MRETALICYALRQQERLAVTIWVLMALATVVLMGLSEHMARARGRSAKAWVWMAAITGPLPLGPLMLYLLSERR